MISDAIAIYELINKKWDAYKAISALFRWNGTRAFGDERIKIEKHTAEDNTWYYSVTDFDDYVFIRIPTHAGCVIEKVGTVNEEKFADSNFFRYVAVPDGRIYGGTPPNVKVDFMIIGYQPKALLNLKESTG